MKIVIVTEFSVPYFHGGGEIRYHEIAKRLVGKGHNVDLICCKFKNSPYRENIDGVNVYHIGPLINNPPYRTITNFIHYIFSCFFFLLTHKYDIIDSNTYIPLIPSFLASKLKRVPLIATVNILIGDWKEEKYNSKVASFLEKLLFKLPYDKIVTVTEYVKRELVSSFKVKSDKIIVINNGVNLDKIDSVVPYLSDENTIVYVGRLIWFKYIEDLVEAIAIVKVDIPGVKLKVVGDGMKMGLLQNKVAEMNLYKNVEILGAKNYNETLKIMKSSSILVLPSTKDTFGMVLIEANAMGIPCVAYNAGGPGEVIINGINGYLTKVRDIKDLANKITKLLSNSELRVQMGINGRKIVENRYTWDKIAIELEDTYLNTLRKI